MYRVGIRICIANNNCALPVSHYSVAHIQTNPSIIKVTAIDYPI